MEELYDILKELKPDVDFRAQQHLIDDHILDSMEIMSLVMDLNEEFDVEITPLEVIPENFQSADAIYRMITRLQNAD